MRTCNDLVRIVNTIADALNEGLTVGFETVDGMQSVVVKDSAGGFELSATVSLPRVFRPKDYREVNGNSSANETSQPPHEEKTATVADKKKSARWWSRYNFEKNIMKMTFLVMQRTLPADISFDQHEFAALLASMMHWKISTAKRHITQAAKMGIINRAVVGTVYHITGVNDEEDNTQQEMPHPSSAIAEEGRIQFEQEFEQAVDETVLP